MTTDPVYAEVTVRGTVVDVRVRLGQAVRGFLIFAAVTGAGLALFAYGTEQPFLPAAGGALVLLGGATLGAIGLAARRRWSGTLDISGGHLRVTSRLSGLGWTSRALPRGGHLTLRVVPMPRGARRSSRLYRLEADDAPLVTASDGVSLRKIGRAVATAVSGTFVDESGSVPPAQTAPAASKPPPAVTARLRKTGVAQGGPVWAWCDVRPFGVVVRYASRIVTILLITLFAGSATAAFVNRGALAALECYGVAVILMVTGMRVRLVADDRGLRAAPRTVFGLPFGPPQTLPWAAVDHVFLHDGEDALRPDLELVTADDVVRIPVRDRRAAEWVFAQIVRPYWTMPPTPANLQS